MFSTAKFRYFLISQEPSPYPHFGLVDLKVAEATCDGKKNMYELLENLLNFFILKLCIPDSTR